MILIDYSQVALANLLAFQKDLKAGSETDVENLIRHTTLSTIQFYKKKYHKEYGDVIICCDGRHYWRRGYFEYYKASRKKNREASDLNWNQIFDILSKIRDEIKANFPYKVVHIDRAEADDIIAALTAHAQEFGSYEKVMIVSSDGDFKQLHPLGDVKQFSPMHKKLVISKHDEVKRQLIEHIVKGDAGDGIPNILSKDDHFVREDAGRQAMVSAKRLQEFFDKGIEACRNDEEKRNWQRNQTLVDFNFIPEDLRQEILNDYLNNKPTADKMTIMTYLMNHRCRLLLESLEDF